MPDLPAETEARPQNGSIQVTKENADLLSVKYLSMIYSRLGYIIKILESKANG